MKIVAIFAQDWGVYNHQMPADDDFQLVYGWVIGELVLEDEDKLIIAHHSFKDEGQVRHITTIPKVCVIKRFDFEIDLED